MTLKVIQKIGSAVMSATNPGFQQQKYIRQASTLHRNAKTAIDKIAVAGTPSIADAGAIAGGSLNGTYYAAVAAGNNAFGTSGISAASASQSIGSGHLADVTVAQVTGADYYDIFFGTNATTTLLHVGRITEAQRAAANPNGTTILTAETIATNGTNATGTVRIGAVGSGLTAANAVFAANNAYSTAIDSIAAITCTGYDKIAWHIAFSVADLRSAPALSLATILEDDQGVQYLASSIAVPLLNGAVGQPLAQVFIQPLYGAKKAYCLIGAISGQTATVSIRAELI